MESRYELLSGSISCMYHDIQKIERTEMAKYGLKGPHAQCLLAMMKHAEGITAARLCEVCEKDKAAISRILAELAEAGMVLRESRNGTRYRALLRLTEGQGGCRCGYGKSPSGGGTGRQRLRRRRAGSVLPGDVHYFRKSAQAVQRRFGEKRRIRIYLRSIYDAY